MSTNKGRPQYRPLDGLEGCFEERRHNLNPVTIATSGGMSVPAYDSDEDGVLDTTTIPAHVSTHANGGADELSVAGLSGELADAQPPKTHAATHTNGTDDIQDATAAQKGLATAAQITKLDGIEAGADVTDAANVDAAGAVMEADYNAQTILAATTDNTPAALTVTEQTFVGRKTGGNIAALSATEARTILNVADGADVTGSNAPQAHAASHAVGGADTVFPADPGADKYLMWDDDPGQLVWSDASGGSGDVATDTIWDAKGDLAVGTGANTASKLTVGANGTYLCADDGEATGLKWASPAGTGDVTAAANMTDNTLLKGDGGAKGIQDTGIAVDDSDNMNMNGGTITNAGHGIADNQVLTVDQADLADNDYLKATANGVEGRSYAEVLSDLATLPSIDEDNMASDSASYLPTQQSVKAYVDNLSGAVGFFENSFDWSAVTGFTTSGTVTPQGALLYFITGATSGNHASIRTTNSWQAIVATGKIIIAEWIIQYVASVTAVTRYFFISADTTLPPTETASHFGFKIVDADIYSSSADGTQETTDTAVNLSTGSQFTVLRAVCNPGTDVKFYVNGVLKATHTTRLPADGSYHLLMTNKTTASGAKDLYISRFLLKRQY